MAIIKRNELAQMKEEGIKSKLNELKKDMIKKKKQRRFQKRMPDICPKCGLPKELCVCETIAKEGQKIKVKVERRKFGKPITIIEGINEKEINLKDLAKKLKSKFACGGTVKNNTIELQGDQSHKVKKALIELGFDENSIE